MKTPINILIADDHELFRDGVKERLSRHTGYNIVGETNSGRQTLKMVAKLSPDIVLLDIQLPDMNGITVAGIITRRHPAIGIIALSMHEDAHTIINMMNAGAKGYVFKRTAPEEILDAIKEVHKNNEYTCKEAGAALKNYALNIKNGKEQVHAFTAREVQVLLLVCQSYSSKDIANFLQVSQRTVETHRENIKIKTKTKTPVDLVVYAIRNGIYTP